MSMTDVLIWSGAISGIFAVFFWVLSGRAIEKDLVGWQDVSRYGLFVSLLVFMSSVLLLLLRLT